jgi:hypothetical protein
MSDVPLGHGSGQLPYRTIRRVGQHLRGHDVGDRPSEDSWPAIVEPSGDVASSLSLAKPAPGQFRSELNSAPRVARSAQPNEEP